jgi:hypothetical protein
VREKRNIGFDIRRRRSVYNSLKRCLIEPEESIRTRALEGLRDIRPMLEVEQTVFFEESWPSSSDFSANRFTSELADGVLDSSATSLGDKDSEGSHTQGAEGFRRTAISKKASNKERTIYTGGRQISAYDAFQ